MTLFPQLKIYIIEFKKILLLYYIDREKLIFYELMGLKIDETCKDILSLAATSIYIFKKCTTSLEVN